MKVIKVAECLDIMEKGEVFSFKCVTFDRNRKKGGDIMEYQEAKLIRKPKKEDVEGDMKRKLTQVESRKLRGIQNHWDNFTRNLRILQDGLETSIIKKIHPPLLIEFNGIPVIP